ncbi:MAG: DinB family protein, partial [Anaerolineae bacterium]|nr:DinB family protein [Anaerolineae bacterium]
MIESLAEFIKYFDGIRGRTLKYLAVLPPEQIDWSPAEGEMTCGDLIRHVAAAERMFVGVVVDGKWHYLGHGREVAPTLAAALDHLNAIHAEAMTRLGQANDSLLTRPRPTLADFEIKAWRFLMAMIEHEVH